MCRLYYIRYYIISKHTLLHYVNYSISQYRRQRALGGRARRPLTRRPGRGPERDERGRHQWGRCEFRALFDGGTFWVLPFVYMFIFTKVPGHTFFPQSVNIHYFCSGPISVDPIVGSRLWGRWSTYLRGNTHTEPKTTTRGKHITRINYSNKDGCMYSCVTASGSN